jgi:hypothetical protein
LTLTWRFAPESELPEDEEDCGAAADEEVAIADAEVMDPELADTEAEAETDPDPEADTEADRLTLAVAVGVKLAPLVLQVSTAGPLARILPEALLASRSSRVIARLACAAARRELALREARRESRGDRWTEAEMRSGRRTNS